MDYAKNVTFDLTNLSEHELSTIQAGLVLLGNGAKQDDGHSYPEYKKTAGVLLGRINPPQADDR